MRISCKEAGRLLSESLDRKLSLWERLKLRFHLVMCAVCADGASQVLLVSEAARRIATDPELLELATGVSLPDEVRQRIKKAMDSSQR